MCELIPSQVESTHLNGSYGIYDNSGPSFGHSSQQHQMNGNPMSAHYESFMAPGHPHHHHQHNSQLNHQQQQQHRYSYHHHQGAPMLPEKGCWEAENAVIPAAINEEFISLKSNDFSISVYHRYNGVAPVSSSLDSLGNEQTINEAYNSHYNNSNFQVACPSQTSVYSAAFHGASSIPPAASRNSSGSSRSLYMPPTPPSSEPGSPSQQQQQIIQQSRAAGVMHQGKPSSGLIHTNQQYLSSGETSTSRKQSPPPFSNGKQRQQGLSQFRQSERSNSAGVAPIVGNGNGPLHLSSGGTIPVPFAGGQCSVRSGDGKVSHSAPAQFGRSGQQQEEYNAAIVAQITAASHGVQPRYNRRNNPELEKRRIHRCDYPG